MNHGKFLFTSFSITFICLLSSISIQASAQEQQTLKSAWSLSDNAYEALKAGDYSNALNLYHKALQLQPKTKLKISIYLNRAGIYQRKLDDYSSAVAEIEKALKLDPDNSAIKYRLAYAQIGINNGKQVQDSEDLIRLYEQGLSRLNKTKNPIQAEKDAALKEFTQALLMIPTPQLASRIHMKRGDIYRSGFLKCPGLIGGSCSFESYSEAIRLDPDNAQAYRKRAIIHSDYQKALADTNEAIRINPQDPRAYGARAFVWRQFGDRPKAIKDIEKMVELYKVKKDTEGYESALETLEIYQNPPTHRCGYKKTNHHGASKTKNIVSTNCSSSQR